MNKLNYIIEINSLVESSVCCDEFVLNEPQQSELGGTIYKVYADGDIESDNDNLIDLTDLTENDLYKLQVAIENQINDDDKLFERCGL